MNPGIFAACAALFTCLLPVAAQTDAAGPAPELDQLVSRIQDKARSTGE